VARPEERAAMAARFMQGGAREGRGRGRRRIGASTSGGGGTWKSLLVGRKSDPASERAKASGEELQAALPCKEDSGGVGM